MNIKGGRTLRPTHKRPQDLVSSFLILKHKNLPEIKLRKRD